MQQFCTTYEITLNKEHNHLSWDAFVYEQSKNGTCAAELFIKAAAALIGVTIILHQSSAAENFHLIKLELHWITSCSSPPLLIGNLSGADFQSLLPSSLTQQVLANDVNHDTDVGLA